MWSSSWTNKFLACNLDLSLDVGGRTHSVTPRKCTDVDDVKYVINVDFPNCSEDYIHRIGRTARSNNTGTAYTFFTFENMKQAKDLVDVLQEANQTVNPKLLDLVEMSRSFSFGRGRKWGGKNNHSSKRGGHFESNRHHPYKRRDDDKNNNGGYGGKRYGGNYGNGNYENKNNNSWGNKSYESRNNESGGSWGNKSYETRSNDYQGRGDSGNSWSGNSSGKDRTH